VSRARRSEAKHRSADYLIFGWNALWVASLIMVATYGIIMAERLNHAIVALVGAALMVMLDVLNQEAAFRARHFCCCSTTTRIPRSTSRAR
jgi:hypothetical protein